MLYGREPSVFTLRFNTCLRLLPRVLLLVSLLALYAGVAYAVDRIEYEYDSFGRLIRVSYEGNYVIEYSYDKLGNRIVHLLYSTRDQDGDGIYDDGSRSAEAGDEPCVGGNTELCDDNCIDTPNADQANVDGDPYGAACECDDGDAASYPGNAEVCDGNDNDCSGAVAGTEVDDDGDGYVECAGWSDTQGDQPDVVGGDDCNDTQGSYASSMYPGSPENERVDGCSDGIDNDCDSLIDYNDADCPYHCPDDDGDGWAVCFADCSPESGVECGDCDDLDSTIHPGGGEACDGSDNDCDGTVDESTGGGSDPEKLLDPDGAGHDRFGATVTGIGDVDGDGIDDLLIGSAQDDAEDGTNSYAGSVSVYSGASFAQLRKDFAPDHSPPSYFGGSLASLGDVNGDGVADYASGADDDHLFGAGLGAVYVLSGLDGTLIRKLVNPTPPDDGNDAFGAAVARLSDVDGDGVDDVIVGSPTDEDGTGSPYTTGTVFVFSGRTGDLLLGELKDHNPSDFQQLGSAVGDAGDVNGDGTSDILVGVPFDPMSGGEDAGSARVYSGSDGSRLAELWDPEPEGGANFGLSVTGCDDLNGDGIPDLAVGAPDHPRGVHGDGRVVLFSGFDFTYLEHVVDSQGAQHAHFGESLARGDDLNGDGIDEIIVGVPEGPTYAESGPGWVVVLSGADRTELRRLEDPDGQNQDNLGVAVASVSDSDGDGLEEMFVGADNDDTAAGDIAGSALFFWSGSGPACDVDQDTIPEDDGDGIHDPCIGGETADCDDNCPWVDNPDQTDADADGVGAACDCGDDDPDAWSTPGEARNLLFLEDKQTLTWDLPDDAGGAEGALVYDTLRSENPEFFGEAAVCVESDDGADREAVDGDTPDSGVSRFYLVRPSNTCGDGTLGLRSNGAERHARGCP